MTNKTPEYGVIIEEYYDHTFPERKYKNIVAYERLKDGGKGEKIWAKHFINGEIVEFDTWETMSWDDFCEKYKGDHDYIKTTSPKS